MLVLVSIPMSNLGGFGLGLLPGLLGGVMVCSWAPLKQPKAAEPVSDPQDAEAAEAEYAGTGELTAAPRFPELPQQTGPAGEAPTAAQGYLPEPQSAEGVHEGEYRHGE